MKPLHPLTFGDSPCAQALAGDIKTEAQARICGSFLSETNEMLSELERMTPKTARLFLSIFRAERLAHVDRLKHLAPFRSLVKNIIVAAFRNTGRRIKTF